MSCRILHQIANINFLHLKQDVFNTIFFLCRSASLFQPNFALQFAPDCEHQFLALKANVLNTVFFFVAQHLYCNQVSRCSLRQIANIDFLHLKQDVFNTIFSFSRSVALCNIRPCWTKLFWTQLGEQSVADEQNEQELGFSQFTVN